MNQRRQYKNPPIEEALCEFRFKPGQDWDLTIPGRLHVKLANTYPGKPRQQKVVEIGLEMNEGTPSGLQHKEALDRVQLITTDEKRIVGVGPNVLSVHMLRPYQDVDNPQRSGWDEFRCRLEEALNVYQEVAKPEGINRIGMRYINKIAFPYQQVQLGDYLSCVLPVVPGLPRIVNGYFSRTEFSYPDGVHLVLSQGTAPMPEGNCGFVLDLDVIWEASDAVSIEDAMKKTDDLRKRERDAFEAVITDQARGLFDAD
jgi:uncharacterized protein (TIGR04255 family)